MDDKRQAAKNLIIRELRELLTTTASIDLYEDVPEVILCALVNHGFISLNNIKKDTIDILEEKCNGYIQEIAKLNQKINTAEWRIKELEKRFDNFYDSVSNNLNSLENKVQEVSRK